MFFDILTLFPEVCRAYCDASILGRAQKAGLIGVSTVDIRDYSRDKHRTVDDAPYGGGDGMVMMAPPVLEALASLPPEPTPWRVLLSPRGLPFNQAQAARLAEKPRLALICGRYEGVDERVAALAVDEMISLGDFVISGGELAALAVVDAVARLIPGVLGGKDSARLDSFQDGLLEHPQYTRPPAVEGLSVPEVLLSGNHAAIDRWRRRESLRNTLLYRPDLLAGLELSREDQDLLTEIRRELAENSSTG